MLEIALPIAAGATSDGGLAVLVVAAIGAAGVVAGAALAPFGEWIKRKDDLKTYKRHVYRNFLDHAYWFRDEGLAADKRQQRAEKYVADWHRIQLIAGEGVQAATRGLQHPGSLTAELEPALVVAFKKELGVGGLG